MGAEAGSHGDGGAATRALGPLFRITEVFLWDYTSSRISKSSTRHDSSPQEDSADYMNSAVSCSNVDSVVDDATSEDLELARQMHALGLPTSFKANKEQRRNTCTRGKRKGVTKSTYVHKVTGVQDLQVPEISSLAEVTDGMTSQISSFSSTTSHTCAAARAENVASRFDTDDTFNKDVQPDGETNNQDVVTLGRIVREQVCSEVMDVVKADSMMDYPSMITTEKNYEDGMKSVDFKSSNLEENEVKNIDHLCVQGEKLRYEQGRGINLEYASSLCLVTKSEETFIDSNPTECCSRSSRFENGIEWGIFWDVFYMRNYYYNFHTQESSWYPPPGPEQAGFLGTSSEINTDVTEEGAYLAFLRNYNNHEHSEKVTSPITEGQNDGELSVQASDEFTSRVDPASENLTSDVHPTLLGGSSNNFDEHVEHTNSSKTSNSADNFCEAPFCLSDTLDQVDRLTVSHDMSAEEKWLCVSKKDDGNHGISVFNDLHSLHHVMNYNKKKIIKGITSNQKMLSGEDKGDGLPEMVERLPTFLIKYWYQRYSLFSKFDLGVKVDEEGWFSVTPEAIARHHASRCGHGIVVDCFTGIGGNAIQFAMKSNHVIAVDIDQQKVDFARHNATIYGVESNIEFIKGDFFILASQLMADTLFMSPPWGGPDYAKVQVYDIKSMLKPRDGYFLFKTAMKIASNVVMFLPRNVDPNQLAELSLLASPPWELEVEKNYLNGRLKGITAYFSQSSNKRQEHTR